MDIEKELEYAMKEITVEDLGPSILNPQRYSEYVKGLMRPETIISDIRFQTMESPVELIDRVISPERVLKRLQEGTAATSSDVTFKQISVGTVPLIGYIPIYDAAMRRNLQRGDFGTVLTDLLVQATRRDIEDFLVYSRTKTGDTSGDILLGSDGFIRQAVKANGDATIGNVDKNVLYGDDTSSTPKPDFDNEISESNVTDLFNEMIKRVPPEYLANPSEFKFFVPYEVADAYREYVGARQTVVGDSAMVSGDMPAYKGIPVKYCPVLNKTPNESDTVIGAFDRPVILAQPNNLIFGLFSEIKVEEDREAKAARTDFVVQVEPAAGVEVPESVVVALPEADKKEAATLFSTS